MRDVRALAAPLAVPAVQVVVADAPSRSHLGGAPALPRDVPWPEKNGSRLAFLARLSLAEVHRALPIPWLPEAGALLFFYDMDEQPWGFDPAHRGGWAVLLVPDPAAPDPAPPDVGSASAAPSFPHRNVAFRRIDVLPSSQRPAVAALGLSERETDEFERIAGEAHRNAPAHQMSGFPSPVQGDDMEEECQLTSHGVYCGDARWRADPRTPGLAPGAADWRLLLQVDSVAGLRLLWGDLGRLYFWVEEPAARKGDFSNVWLVLQCT